MRGKFTAADLDKLLYQEAARNKGYQIEYMKEQRRKNGKNIADNIVYVTKHTVLGVEGVKGKAVYCVVERATTEVDWKKPEFKTNGINRINGIMVVVLVVLVFNIVLSFKIQTNMQEPSS